MMRRALPFALLLLLAGCGGLPANVVVLMPDDDGHTGHAVVSSQGGQIALDEPLAATALTQGKAFVAKQKDVDETFSAAVAATPRKPLAFLLYFQSEAAEIAPDSKAVLQQVIAAAKAEANVDVSVVGHTDAAGAADYNLQLSLRRAKTVRDALVAAGLPADVIEVTYHGANNPLVPMGKDGHEPRNRRVEVVVR
jgi:outer membrane protein OmpA-like peptidoglycan-associated protein